jgi:T-complex protein 1 subunit eta
MLKLDPYIFPNYHQICIHFFFFYLDAVLTLDTQLSDIRMVGIKKVTGGSVTDSMLVQGVAFKKTFSYAGFEQQTKHFKNPKVLVLNVELELKSEKENAEVRITDPDQYQDIVDAEWKIIYEKLDKCAESGANIVLSKLPIGDLGVYTNPNSNPNPTSISPALSVNF